MHTINLAVSKQNYTVHVQTQKLKNQYMDEPGDKVSSHADNGLKVLILSIELLEAVLS